MASRNQRTLKGIEKTLAEKANRIEELWAIEEKEDRPLEESEREEVMENTKALRELKVQKEEVEANIALEKEVKEASSAVQVEDDEKPEFYTRPIGLQGQPVTEAKSLGQQFVESKAYKDFYSRGGGGGQGEWKMDSVDLQTKATVVSGGTVSGYGPYQQDVPGVIPINVQPPTVADLMPNNTASGPQVRFFKERVATNAAAGVGESGSKPQSAFDFFAKTANVTKIATLLPVTDEMLEDAPAISAYLNSRLTQFVKTEEDRQLLRGGAANEVVGFIDTLARTGVGTAVPSVTGAPGTASFGEIASVMNNQRGSSLLNPDALLMHPAQFGSIIGAYDKNGQYYGGGPLTVGAYGGGPQAQASSNRFNPPTLFNVPVYITSVLGNGTALLGNFANGAAVWRRGGISVQASNSHASYFALNQTAIRAEERLALTIYRPEAFTVINWN